MSDRTLYKYRVYCQTMGSFQFIWDTDPPTVCPQNNTHTIDTSSITIVDEVDNSKIKIQEESVPTGGNYQATTVSFMGMTGPTGATYVQDVTWPHPISAMNISVQSTEEHMGDVIDVMVGPDTTIGVLTNFGYTGATGIYVNDTVIDNTAVGYYLKLFDGVQLHDCGRIMSIDSTNNIVAPEFPPTSTFSPLSPTYVLQTVYTVKDFRCCIPQKFDIGMAKIGGSYVPANTIIRGIYTLNRPIENPKNFTAMIEYLY